MPTLKSIHICNSHLPNSSQKLQKSMSLPTLTDGRKKYENTTTAIRNAGFRANLKVSDY